MVNSWRDLLQTISASSCIGAPFMKFGNDPNSAPVLNYSLPQKTTFRAYGSVTLQLPAATFNKRFTTSEPENRGKQNEKQAFFEKIIARGINEAALSDFKKSKLLKSTSAKDLVVNLNVPVRMELTPQNLDDLSVYYEAGMEPGYYQSFSGQNYVQFTPPITQLNPQIYIIEEYSVSSYLGNYGAGKTLTTFSLLPGEKTAITMRTYRESNINKSASENILDSFTKESANELDSMIEAENSTATNDSTSSAHAANISLSVSGTTAKLVGVSANVGYSYNHNAASTRAANTKALNRAVSKHVEKSNSNRNIQINTATQESLKEGEEQTIVRELTNYNKSRTLNFVFRQLLQEYITITYLSNIRIAFANGNSMDFRVVDIENLDALLEEVLDAGQITLVREQILRKYCKIINWQGDPVDFLSSQTIDYSNCSLGQSSISVPAESYYRLAKGLKDIFKGLDDDPDGQFNIAVPGVILNVDKYVLQTPSVIVDSLLGQGEALDCFNNRLQISEAIKAYLENAEQLQKLEILEALSDPEKQTDAYKKIFGACCITPQTEIIK